MTPTGEVSCEHFSRQNGGTGAAHPLQLDQHPPFALDRRILLVGRITFLLDLAKLGLNKIEAGIFALQFAAQPFGERMAFGGRQPGKIDPGQPKFRIDASNALSEKQALDPIDMACAFANQTLSFPMRSAGILLFDRRHAHDSTDVTLSAINRAVYK